MTAKLPKKKGGQEMKANENFAATSCRTNATLRKFWEVRWR